VGTSRGIVVENLEFTHERLLPFLSGWSATRKLSRKDLLSALNEEAFASELLSSA